MPLAVTHILVPMIFVDFLRDHFFKSHRRKWPNKYIFLVGVAGLIPDADMPLSILLTGTTQLHRTFTHTIWLPLIFLVLAAVSYALLRDLKVFGFRLWKSFLLVSLGISSHLFLDALLAGSVNLLYPLKDMQIGLNLIPEDWIWFHSSLDALLLLGWLIHEELEHNISEYF
ncbi:hypothetical protein A3K63_03885 [Candidatus Micrarchaeota archaeon RBG_16_49_10]|nr:MAG: hypothetical protein A3K63_03885 [Candidatus Micrarchaeota archaeon RBG_16_49_10]